MYRHCRYKYRNIGADLCGISLARPRAVVNAQSTSTMLPLVVRHDGRGADDATRTADPSSPSSTEPAATSSAPAALRLRDRQRYEIRAEQGRGGLGLVWRAHDRELGRDVAVKELLQRGGTSELRFLREALITSRLEHPGIVPVHEAGRWSDGTPFYTMKLVAGRSLHDRIAEQRTLDERLALLPNIVSVADAIAYAHDCGVIHRDLKPSNVMVGDFGETIVIDWGLAKVLDDAGEQGGYDVPYRSSARTDLTAIGSVLGTPAYMAPEQYRGVSDARTDVYALGGILHHVLTGKPPHERTPSLDFSPPQLRYARNTPQDLIAIVKRALAAEPAQRYQLARAFGDDLKRYLRRERVAARRYSLPSRLALAFARHRTVAVVLMAALAALAVTFGIALLKIQKERADAVSASKLAVINAASAMLERDPTRASEALRALSASEAPALLRARIRAAGVADRRIALPGRFDQKHVLGSGERVVVSTGERTLHVLDTRTGEMIQIADGLTEPAIWAATDDRVFFVRNTLHPVVSVVPVAGGPVVDVATLDALPRDLLAADDGAFWVTAANAAVTANVGKPPRLVAADVQTLQAFGHQLMVCTTRGSLQMGSDDQQLATVGTCPVGGGAWNVSARGFVYAAREVLYVYDGDRLVSISATGADVMQRVALTDTGLVVGIGPQGEGLLYRRGASVVEHVALADTPETVAGFGNIAAWAFSDGTVEAVDTVDGKHWTIHATVGRPSCLGVLGRRRLVTCDRDEVRLWTLPHDAPVLVTTLPAFANNVVFDEAGDALFDGVDGHAYEIKAGERRAVSIHAHDDVSYGAAWCGAEACTSGWDGRVICSDRATGATRVTADLHSVTPWLASGNGHCFTAAANGGVYDLRSPTAPAYTHEHEPYRVAVSDDGRYEASGDWAGDIIVYDSELKRVVARARRAHEGRVTNLAWAGQRLVSSGADANVRLWSFDLRELTSWHMPSIVRYMAAAGDTVGMALDDGTLALRSTTHGTQQRITIGVRVTALAVDPHGQFVAAGTNDGELIVLSTDGRAAAMRLGKGHVSCLGFDTATSMVACAAHHAVMRLPLSAMSFETSSGGKL